MRRRPHGIGCIQPFDRRWRDLAVASRRVFLLPAQLLIAVSGAETIAPALMATGLLCLVLPWANRENPWVRCALVAASLIITWNYLFWRITQTLPPAGFTASWLLGIGFLGTELLTAVGGSITWILLSRTSSRSKTVDANMPWLMQATPLVDVLICTYNEDRAI